MAEAHYVTAKVLALKKSLFSICKMELIIIISTVCVYVIISDWAKLLVVPVAEYSVHYQSLAGDAMENLLQSTQQRDAHTVCMGVVNMWVPRQKSG